MTRQHSGQQREPGRIPRMQRKVAQIDRRRINHSREQPTQTPPEQSPPRYRPAPAWSGKSRARDRALRRRDRSAIRIRTTGPARSAIDAAIVKPPASSSALGGGLRPSSIVIAARTIADAPATSPIAALVARRNSLDDAADARRSRRGPIRSRTVIPAMINTAAATSRRHALRTALRSSGDSDTSTSGSPPGA